MVSLDSTAAPFLRVYNEAEVSARKSWVERRRRREVAYTVGCGRIRRMTWRTCVQRWPFWVPFFRHPGCASAAVLEPELVLEWASFSGSFSGPRLLHTNRNQKANLSFGVRFRVRFLAPFSGSETMTKIEKITKYLLFGPIVPARGPSLRCHGGTAGLWGGQKALTVWKWSRF